MQLIGGQLTAVLTSPSAGIRTRETRRRTARGAAGTVSRDPSLQPTARPGNRLQGPVWSNGGPSPHSLRSQGHAVGLPGRAGLPLRLAAGGWGSSSF